MTLPHRPPTPTPPSVSHSNGKDDESASPDDGKDGESGSPDDDPATTENDEEDETDNGEQTVCPVHMN